MSLAKRIIPTLLADGEKLVKGTRFLPWRVVGHVEQAARLCGMRGVDEIILLDVRATPDGREPNYRLIERIAEAVMTPLTVGGGVRTKGQFQSLLNAGADKVAIGSRVFEEGGADFLAELKARYGAQAIVVAIDCRGHAKDWPGAPDNEVWTHGGTQGPIRTARATAHAQALANLGAGEILLTSIDREGTMKGYDLELVRRVSHAVEVPVIAHGGAGTYQHMLEAIQAGADAVAAGAMFQFTDQTPRGAAEYLARHGVETRIPA